MDGLTAGEVATALQEARVMFPDELETNRISGITLRQISTFRSTAYQTMIVRIVFLVAITIGIVNSSHLIGGFWPRFFIAIFIVAYAWSLLSNLRRLRSDFESQRVETQEGVVTHRRERVRGSRRSHIRYFYQINNVVLEVSRQADNALIEGRYRVYYLPVSRTLVNIEPIDEIYSTDIETR